MLRVTFYMYEMNHSNKHIKDKEEEVENTGTKKIEVHTNTPHHFTKAINLKLIKHKSFG